MRRSDRTYVQSDDNREVRHHLLLGEQLASQTPPPRAESLPPTNLSLKATATSQRIHRSRFRQIT